ncbi:hypothetical protein Btru_025325 [Bulinus truncatus]|nr:hypothetical protein Btru_025325 [Bulinus truncatus]
MFNALDPSCTKAVLTNGKPFNISFEFDPQDKQRKYPFDEYFVHEYSTSSNSYVIRMIQGIDRDGIGTEDDVDMLQTCSTGCFVKQWLVMLTVQIGIVDVNDNAPFFPSSMSAISFSEDNAEPLSAQKSASVSFKIAVTNGSAPNIDFRYPSCIQSLQPQRKKCILPRYFTSVISGEVSEVTLDFYPDPADPNNPGARVDIIVDDSQKRAEDNFTVTCLLLGTLPAGYDNMFKVATVKFGANDYKCQVTKLANKSLDIADIKKLQLIIFAWENRLESDFASIYLTVQKRSPPILSLNGSVGFIYENASGGDYVSSDSIRRIPYRLLFIDPDSMSSGPATLFNVSVELNSPFTVDAQGYITLTDSILDYESVKQYTLIVSVFRNGDTKLSSNTTLTIHILDTNDNPPVITSPENFIMSIPQGDCNCNFARIITMIQATDVDYGPPMFKLFRVIPPAASSMFTVDEGGAVSLHRPIRAGDVYALIVEAYDQGNPPLSTEVILVIIVNSLTPASSYQTNQCVIYMNGV